jgi:hypothetical protein
MVGRICKAYFKFTPYFYKNQYDQIINMILLLDIISYFYCPPGILGIHFYIIDNLFLKLIVLIFCINKSTYNEMNSDNEPVYRNQKQFELIAGKSQLWPQMGYKNFAR